MPVSDSLSAVHDCSRFNKGYNTFGIDRTAVDTDFKMQVVNITSCALLAASTLYQGRADSGSSPAKDDDDWYYGD